MNKRIEKLSDSPCYQCNCSIECEQKIEKAYKLQEIKDYVFSRKGYDYRECPIWIALNAPEMVEVDE